MTKNFINVLVIFVIILFLNSCVTLARGTRQKIEITSEPSGAKISEDGIPLGETPIMIKLKRLLHHSLIIDKEGYKSIGVFIESIPNNTLEAIAGCTLVFGGLIDFTTGAVNDLIPSTLHIMLQSENTLGKHSSSALEKRE